MNHIKHIAQGGPFDIVDAIRQIAAVVVVLDERMAPDETVETPRQHMEKLLNVRLASILAAAGYDTLEKVRTATDDQLLSISGVGDRAVAMIRENL